MSKVFVAFLFCLNLFGAYAQQTELFISTQSGNPFDAGASSSDKILWNYSFGVEQYFIDKLSLAISYRKPFYLEGGDINYESTTTYNGFEITSEGSNKMYAIDFESKYFFEETDEGWYMSSGISYQHIEMNLDITYVYDLSGNYAPPPIAVGAYQDNVSIFPLTVKAGHRNSGDIVVFDYYFGLSYNLGSGNVTHKNPEYLTYDPLKKFSFIVGLKVGFKF